MESVAVKKNRFSLKNKAGASKFSSAAKQNDSKYGTGTNICDAKITEKEPTPTERITKCYLPPLNNSNLFYDWKPLPTIEDMMEVPAKCDNENKLNPANTKTHSNVWVPLPKPCLKCMAQHFPRAKLIVQEVVTLEERRAEVAAHPSGFVEGPQLTSKMQDLQIERRTSSSGYYVEKKDRLDTNNSSDINESSRNNELE